MTNFSKMLETNKTLKVLSLCFDEYSRSANISTLFDSLCKNNTIQSFKIRCNKLFKNDFTQLSEYIGSNISLTSFSLICDTLTDASISQLALALEKNKTVKKFKLFILGYGGISSCATNMIISVLGNSTISKIGLGIDFVDDTPIETLLFTNSFIRELDFKFSFISNKCCEKIATCLETICSLETLILDNTEIKTDGIITIINALNTNKTVHKLSLQNNRIEKSVVAAIAKMLETNQTLRELNLKNNNDICYDSSITIVKALSKNQTLTKLYLRNYVNLRTCMFAKYLEENYTLLFFDFCVCDDTLYEIIQRNNDIYDNMRFKTIKVASNN